MERRNDFKAARSMRALLGRRLETRGLDQGRHFLVLVQLSLERRFDTLVLATVAEPDTTFVDGIIALGDCPPYHVVGDCNAPRKAHMAIYEGRKAALEIV